MIRKNRNGSKLYLPDFLEMKIGNLIAKCKENIRRNLDNYKNIYTVVFWVGLFFLTVFNIKIFIHYLFQLSTFASAIVALYLGKGKNKIQIGQNYDVRKGYAGVNLFGKNNSSCVIEITGIDIMETRSSSIVIPEYYFKTIINSEISKTRIVDAKDITRISIIDIKNKIDVLNPVLKSIQKTSKKDVDFISWINCKNGANNYEINVYYRRNDEYGKNSVQIPLKRIIDEDLINLKEELYL